MKASRKIRRRREKNDRLHERVVNGRMLVPGLRPEQYLMALESDYRGIGDWYDRFFKEPNREAWPAWCYCPMDEAYDWARLRGLEGDTKEAARVGALTAWRATKGIYPMDLERLDRVMREPSPELSADWVTQLPEWCVYMEFQDCHVVVDVGRGESCWLMGVFAWLSLGVGGEPELWLLADTDVGLVAPEIVSTAATAEPPEPGSLASFVVKVLRHLCSAPRRRASREAGLGRHTPPAAIQRRGSVPAEVTIWETTFCRRPEARPPVGIGKKGTPKRPHIRVAHEHRYWVGTGENRRLVTRWLKPININLDGVPELPTRRLVEEHAA